MYGCNAVWGNMYDPGLDNDDVEDICAEGYHVCGDTERKDMDDYSLIWQLSPEKCISNMEENVFYASSLRSEDGVECGEDGDNNVFGLGYTNQCGPFGAILSNDSASQGSKAYGWRPCKSGSESWCSGSERNQVSHNNATSDEEIIGGVMCCRDLTTSYCQTQEAADCAHCARYGPCLNSVDPKCITTEALVCIS